MSDSNFDAQPQIDDDNLADHDPNYKVPPKKTFDEYQNLDANDESLRKWKESIGVGASAPAIKSDGPKVLIKSVGLEFEGGPDLVYDVSTPEGLERLEKNPVVVKEGSQYRFKVTFSVQNDIVTGFKYLQVVKRKGIRVEKETQMIGSYGPSKDTYEKKFALDETPSGFLARAKYDVKSKFSDDDNECYLEFNWTLEIKKSWE